MPEKTIKTAFRFSIIEFYFVTCFYSLYDICMARQMIKTTIETTGFALKQCTTKVVSIVSIVVKKMNLVTGTDTPRLMLRMIGSPASRNLAAYWLLLQCRVILKEIKTGKFSINNQSIENNYV